MESQDRRGSGDAAFERGDIPGALTAYGEADDTALGWRVGRCRQLLGQLTAAFEAYAARPAAGDAADDRVLLLAWRATCHFLAGNRDGCREDVRLAADLAGDAPVGHRALATLAIAQAMEAAQAGDRAAKLAHYEAALQHARAAADDFQQLRILTNLGSRALEEGDLALALRRIEEALDIPDASRWPTVHAITLVNRAEALVRSGRLEEATVDLSVAQEAFVAHASPLQSTVASMLGTVYRLRGETAMARLALEEALALSTRGQQMQSGVRTLAELGFLVLADDPDQAAGLLAQARAWGASLQSARLDSLQARIAFARGDEPTARQAATSAAETARRERDRPGLALALETMATVDPHHAADHLRQALSVWRAAAEPIGILRTELRLAELGRGPESLGTALRVERRLRDLGARGLAQDAAVVVARLRDQPEAVVVRCLGAVKVLRQGQVVPVAEWGSRIDGIPLTALSEESLAAIVGVVTQETYLVHDTIRANLVLAKPEATEAQLWAALGAAQVADLVGRLPDGLDTVVGSRGHRFSGGEKQRLAIARTILRDPKVLILDEATSALDNRTERAVQQAIDNLSEGRTTITIAHRLSTIREADQIAVLERGRVAERGTHHDLLARGDRYAALVAAGARAAYERAA